MVLKRTFDIVVSLVGLILISPVYLIISLLIKLFNARNYFLLPKTGRPPWEAIYNL